MPEHRSKCLILSDFNVRGLCAIATNDPAPPLVSATSGPFGQVMGILLDAAHPCWQAKPDVALVWTQPQAVIESFGRLLAGHDIAPTDLLVDVDKYATLVADIAGRVRSVFVPTWVGSPLDRGLGMVDLKHPRGVSGALLAMNGRLVEKLRTTPGVFVLDAQRWTSLVGKAAFSPQMWHLAKVPFASAVFVEAVAELKAALAALAGQSRKLVILDLDDTLWGGLVGETGWEGIKLGGHDPIGEAFVGFQRALKAIESRGVILGIVSKNEELPALTAIEKHPEMVLRAEDFAGWRINWNDKPRNIIDLAKELNLGLQSVVFIDNSAAERDQVRQALPDVVVPDWPADPMLYAQAFAQLRCFDSPDISAEDQTRAKLYAVERQRRALGEKLVSADDFVRSLEVRVYAEPLTRANLTRAAQLLNKTNQMNLAGRRMSAEELWAWSRNPGRHAWTLRVADRFGDSGLVGFVSLNHEGDQAEVVDFTLSCRVFGRQIEEAMLFIATRQAQSLGAKRVLARYQATERNKPTLAFLSRSGLEQGVDGCFSWDNTRAYPAPTLITFEPNRDV